MANTESTHLPVPPGKRDFTLESLALALGAGGVIGLGWYHEDRIAAGFLCLVLGTAILGYLFGAASLASKFIGLITAVRFAEPAAQYTASLDRYLPTIPDEFRGYVILLATGLGLMLLVSFLTHLVLQRCLACATWLAHVNRWGGATLGAMYGGSLSVLLIMAAMTAQPLLQELANRSHDDRDTLVSLLATQLSAGIREVEKSSLRGVVDSIRPVQRRFAQRIEQTAESFVARHATSLQQSDDVGP